MLFHNRSWCVLLGIIVMVLSSINSTQAQVQLPSIFGDHMVLQRGLEIPVWGKADANEIIEVRLNNSLASVRSDHQGLWKISLPAMKAGGPYRMDVRSRYDSLVIQDIYIGEVWLCSGQSNMEWPLKNCTEGTRTIPLTNNPLIRLWHLKKKHDTFSTPYTQEELSEFSNGDFFHDIEWELSTSATAAEFSGVGYFFGQTLHDSLENIAIGLIQAAVGGSPAQSWIDTDQLRGHPQLESLLGGEDKGSWLDSEIIHPWLAERAEENWAGFDTLDKQNLPPHPFAPGYLYEAAIKLIAPYPIRGVIWYQGESNATHPESYPFLMEVLIKTWRSLWGQGDFPFYFVQLPRIENRNLWPDFREAQEASLAIPNTGMVVTIDHGHPTDVHPREKKEIGRRLANLALSGTYNKNIPSRSPAFLSFNHKVEDRKLILKFDYSYEGLFTHNNEYPKGFVLQGYLENGSIESIVSPEEVSIDKNEIIIVYPKDFLPVMLKYAWAPYPEHNVVNSSDLPLAPFKIVLR